MKTTKMTKTRKTKESSRLLDEVDDLDYSTDLAQVIEGLNNNKSNYLYGESFDVMED